MAEQWFSFDPEGDGFLIHDSKSSAVAAFEKSEAQHTRWAERDGYWPDTTECVCYGVVSETLRDDANNHLDMDLLPEIDDNPNRITPEIRIRELTETLERVIAERDELRQLLIDLQESASYWSEYDVPLGIVDRINTAIRKATT